ncbi:MAG TPA: response regulator transcription factor [Candidatus Obscuribacterales bacterium]
MIRVMIVDDQALVRRGLASLLALESDIQVVGEASNGSEAVSLLESLKPDVILMDMRMPILDGVEATREIVKRSPQTRILVLTTFDDDEYIFLSLKAGASGYLLKDTPSEDLSAAIRAVHHGHTQLGPSIAPKVLSRLKPFSPPSSQAAESIKFMTEREQEILNLIAQGMNNKEIASQLNITEGTVKNHISSILTQLGVRDRTQAALWAKEHLG